MPDVGERVFLTRYRYQAKKVRSSLSIDIINDTDFQRPLLAQSGHFNFTLPRTSELSFDNQYSG